MWPIPIDSESKTRIQAPNPKIDVSGTDKLRVEKPNSVVNATPPHWGVMRWILEVKEADRICIRYVNACSNLFYYVPIKIWK
jgi:hypothetical protein